jgi:hypothetical protein
MILQIHQALNKWQKAEFDYGSVDCCQFAGFIVRELTGIDYLRDFAYESEQAAEQIIDGFGDLERTAASVLGVPTRDFESLADGSPVIVKAPQGQLMGIKLGSVAVCLVKKGLARIPRNHIHSGWNLCKL